MAKKQTSTAKKKTSTAKKPSSPAKKNATAKKKPASAKKPAAKTPAVKKVKAVAVPLNNSTAVDASGERNVDLIPPDFGKEVLQQIVELHNEWDHLTGRNLTLLERRRKIGPGNSNYGFVDKVSDVAMANPEYAHYISLPDLKNAIRNVEVCRDVFAALQAFSRSVTNAMLIYSTEAFRIALDYYNQVKLRKNQGDPTAIELYRILDNRFRKQRKGGRPETNKQVERDVHDILTHKKDGEVIVRGSGPKIVKGKTEVIDDVHKGKAEIKGKFDDQIEN